MTVKVRFDLIANCYLKERYPEGIRYDTTDNLTIFLFSLFRKPKPGEINRDESDGVLIILSDQWVHDGRIFISASSVKSAKLFVENFVKDQLFHELELLLVNTPHKRFRGINFCIDNFMNRYGLDKAADRERFKKAFYRHRQKIEKISGSFVPSRPLDLNTNVPYHGYPSPASR